MRGDNACGRSGRYHGMQGTSGYEPVPGLPCSLRDRWRVGDTDGQVHGSPSNQVNGDYLVPSLSQSSQAEMAETRTHVEAVKAVELEDLSLLSRSNKSALSFPWPCGSVLCLCTILLTGLWAVLSTRSTSRVHDITGTVQAGLCHSVDSVCHRLTDQ